MFLPSLWSSTSCLSSSSAMDTALKFHQALVFEQGDGDLFGLYVYNEFACHNNWLLNDSIYYLNKEQTRETFCFTSLFFISVQIQTKNYFLLLCLFFLSLFLRLCVDILCLFFFFPLGIASKFLWVNTIVYYFFTERVNVFAGLNAGMLCSGMIIVVFLEMLRAVF